MEKLKSEYWTKFNNLVAAFTSENPNNFREVLDHPDCIFEIEIPETIWGKLEMTERFLIYWAFKGKDFSKSRLTSDKIRV